MTKKPFETIKMYGLRAEIEFDDDIGDLMKDIMDPKLRDYPVELSVKGSRHFNEMSEYTPKRRSVACPDEDHEDEDVLFESTIYAHVHSSTQVSLSPFGTRFDSGAIGSLRVTKNLMTRKMGVSNPTPADAAAEAKQFVSHWNDLLQGNVFCFNIIDEADDESMNESLYGSIGLSHTREYARNALWSLVKGDRVVRQALNRARARPRP